MQEKKYSLRERKHALTKITIVDALIKRLQHCRYDDISIRELCKEVEISEGTFFNYFPEKIDIINYYMNLLTLKIIWRARQEVMPGKYLAMINTIFMKFAEELTNVNLINQLIAIMIIQKEKPRMIVILNSEKQLVYPEYAGMENISTTSIEGFFTQCLRHALKNGELPRNTDVEDVLISLLTLLGGTLMTAKFENNQNKAYHYARQLRLLWNGLGVRKTPELEESMSAAGKK
ncbi:MAG: TetR/AcrR family transcriptional regulator [Chlamydiota bacterium]